MFVRHHLVDSNGELACHNQLERVAQPHAARQCVRLRDALAFARRLCSPISGRCLNAVMVSRNAVQAEVETDPL